MPQWTSSLRLCLPKQVEGACCDLVVMSCLFQWLQDGLCEAVPPTASVSGVYSHPPLPPFGVQSCVLTSGAVCTPSSHPACRALPSGPQLCSLSCFLKPLYPGQMTAKLEPSLLLFPVHLATMSTVSLSIPERQSCSLEQRPPFPFSSCLFLFLWDTPPPQNGQLLCESHQAA